MANKITQPSSRAQIRKEMKRKIAQIKKIEKEMEALFIQDMLFCDKKQWYKEQEEDVVISRRPKKIERQKIGRLFWKEKFVDEDTGKGVFVERQRVVRINGVWQFYKWG